MSEVLNPEALNQALAGAMRLLATREHSQHELRRKLSQKGHEPEPIEESLQQLAQQDLQSDDRFVESFVRSHRDRGKGPQRIFMELQQHVDESLIEKYLDRQDTSWFDSAAQVRAKKYGDRLPVDYKEQMKQAKFLEYRGFTHEQIFSILKTRN